VDREVESGDAELGVVYQRPEEVEAEVRDHSNQQKKAAAVPIRLSLGALKGVADTVPRLSFSCPSSVPRDIVTHAR
jgi:hypothetical protein